MVGEPFTATCSATFSPDLSGSIQLQWRNERGDVIEVGSGNSSANTSFTIESFSMADSTVIGGYNCLAAISASDAMRSYDIVLGMNILFTCETSTLFLWSPETAFTLVMCPQPPAPPSVSHRVGISLRAQSSSSHAP